MYSRQTHSSEYENEPTISMDALTHKCACVAACRWCGTSLSWRPTQPPGLGTTQACARSSALCTRGHALPVLNWAL
eukprot:1159284-Pelagomonas_calceolata.AAC.4